MEAIYWLANLGREAVTSLWIPLLFWTLVAIPVFYASRQIGRRKPAVHYYVLVTLLGSLLMGFVMLPVWNGINALGTIFQAPELVLPIEGTEDGFFFPPPGATFTPELSQEPAAASVPSATVYQAAFIGLATIVLLVWSLLAIAGLIHQVYRTRRISTLLVPFESEDAQRILEKVKNQVGVRPEVSLMKGTEEVVPMTFGWKRPVIVVPGGIEREPAVLEAVLYHEMIHVKRKDFLVGVSTRFLSALFRFHPLVQVIDRSIQTYRELSCDNELLGANVISPINYAHLLLKFNAAPQRGYTIPMIQKNSVIKHRIKAMSEFSPSSFRINAMVGWGAALVLLFLPAFFMACNIEAEQIQEPYVAPEGATVIEDLKIAFELPEGWWENGEPVRATSADLVEQVTPEQLEEIRKTDPSMVTGSPDDLQTALYSYVYHNLPADADSIPDNMEEALFFHFLVFNVHTYYDKYQLSLWSRGRCGRFLGESCYKARIKKGDVELIRVLGPDETPFAEGTGFLYRNLKSQIPMVSYVFYIVRDGWAYRIAYDITDNALGDAPYPPLLDTVGFIE